MTRWLCERLHEIGNCVLVVALRVLSALEGIGGGGRVVHHVLEHEIAIAGKLLTMDE